MSTRETPLSSSALLRVSGLPIRYWLAGANADFFEKVKRLQDDEERYRVRARQLADEIGRQLVPHAALSRAERALLLAARRRLHRGEAIDTRQSEHLLAVVRRLPNGDLGLISDLVRVTERGRELAESCDALGDELAYEQERLWRLPEEILRDSPLARALFPPRDPNRTAASEHVSLKQRRRRFEYAWGRITRAATSSTPRDWFSQVAFLEVKGASPRRTPAVTATFAAQWTENVRSRRRALAEPRAGWPEPNSLLALNPLRWDEGEQLVCVVLDQQEESTQVVVRRTFLLDAICKALEAGPGTFGELAQVLGGVAEEERLALPGFVRHLAVIGILQPLAPPPVVSLEREVTPAEAEVRLPVGEGRSGWLDVYRYAESGMSRVVYADLQARVSKVLRLFSLLSSSVRPPAPLEQNARASWLFADILQAELEVTEPLRPEEEEEAEVDGLPPALASQGCAALVDTLSARIERSAVLDIDTDLLDDLGAPDDGFSWPLDCLLRLPAAGASFIAVLEQFWPPGRGDARFAETLADLHGSIPHVENYRRFLHELEERTGILFVELLAPPLADGAANAVRRPLYTRAWTGDPDTAAYLPGDARPERYVSLQAIQIRRQTGRLRAQVDGRPIWPVYHATRSFSPPWDRLARILLATAPYDAPWAYGRFDAFALFPERRAVPRITVGESIVVSPAQWRLSAEECWDKASPTITKIRKLRRLRDRLSLPRWVYLVSGAAEHSIPCDLESLHGIRALERCIGQDARISVREMVPAPNQLLVADRAHRRGDRLVSELLVRFPYDETASAMAARLAPAILASAGLRPGSTSPSLPSPCRGPPSREPRLAKTA